MLTRKRATGSTILKMICATDSTFKGGCNGKQKQIAAQKQQIRLKDRSYTYFCYRCNYIPDYILPDLQLTVLRIRQ